MKLIDKSTEKKLKTVVNSNSNNNSSNDNGNNNNNNSLSYLRTYLEPYHVLGKGPFLKIWKMLTMSQ